MRDGFRNLSSGICGLALLIILIVTIIGLLIWYIVWYLSERVQIVVENNPVTQIVINITDLVTLINGFINLIIDFIEERINLNQVLTSIDQLVEELKTKLVSWIGEDLAHKYADLFKGKFYILANLVDQGQTILPPKLLDINRELAKSLLPAFYDQVYNFLNRVDDNIVGLAIAQSSQLDYEISG